MDLSRRELLALGAVALPMPAKIGTIEIGVCGSLEDFEKAAHYGFDYFEPGAAAVAALNDSEFTHFRERVLASSLRCTSCNSFIRTMQVVGPNVDSAALNAYVQSTVERCSQLGTRIIVWGSASSRNVPEGFPRDRAWLQIRDFLRQAGDIARVKNIVIAIEPLRRQESNILNTGAEALRLVDEVNHPNVQMIIDYYHLRQENEDPEILVRAREHIVHLHFANPDGRRWPKRDAEDPHYARFFELLKQTGYRGGISIEGRGSLDQDAAGSLAFFALELR